MTKLGKSSNVQPKVMKSSIKDKSDKSFLLLKELESLLPDELDTDEKRKPDTGKSNKSKKAIAMRETERMKLVQQHPSFQSDPLAAMKSHIQQLVSKPSSQHDKLKKK
eukprot:CAMPEP_0182427438 /NCGR_PEP_ID=MMETSP1167-20130531/17174_1 /TAXON_ID=2988 /ORGANISM="Mallomonas Sp, Strain CCMP3275" /LENGTH=107 /DNA_ID=CAMNT_0024609667 /DNA_START=193 /DNA_END=516 /DNA_ORIENTATION=-